MGTLVSSREVNILTVASALAYGLDAEVSWNKGISIDQRLKLFGRDASLAIDYFRNDFTNQVVVDVENPHEVNFYNLGGRSFSNSFQAELGIAPFKGFDMRVAYRYFDVQTSYGNELKQKPFTARNRAFANLAYTNNGWNFDYTVNYIGKKRIPSMEGNPYMHEIKDYSPTYMTMNAQVSKTLGKKKNFDIYLGGENLTDYLQMDAILGAEDPFGPHFDASMIWGPVSGRLVYAGFRYSIK
jgi:hypothetical protein